MSAKAFVLIQAEGGKSHEVAAAIKNVDGVTSVDCVTGPYEFIAVVDVERLDEIGKVIEKIQRVPRVSRVVCCLVLRSFQGGEE